MEASLTLTTDMIMVLAVLGLTMTLFVFEIVRVDVAAVSIMVLLGLTGMVPTENLFNGFASNAVISIIAVMILGAGLDRTGVMSKVAGLILNIGGRAETRIIPLVSGTVGIISGFMQNVGAAALFIPVISRISTRSAIPMSRLLMPMGFCAILGGTLTMIGSSPVILLNDLIEAANRSLPEGVEPIPTFGLFDITPVGLALITAGILYFLLLGRHLLPSDPSQVAVPGETKDYFSEVYQIKGELVEVLVTVDSPLVGMTVLEAENHPGMPVLVAMKSGEETIMAPPADEMIWVGCVLAVLGNREQIRHFAEENELKVLPGLNHFRNQLNPARAGIAEILIAPNSKYAGSTIGDEHFRQRYQLSILAVNRGGEIHRENLRDWELAPGDTLVVHSSWKNLAELKKNRDFVVITDLPTEEERPHKVMHAVFFFLLAMSMVIFTDLKLSIVLLTGAMGMVLTGVLSMDEAYQAVSWKTVFLLAGLIPLGYAMEHSGTAAWIAQQTVTHLGHVPEWVLQSAIAVLATFFTLVMSNVGATVLLVPLAINIAIASGGDPAAFAITVALATSNAFLLPTHQVNALIMGPGGYSVKDFMRVGGIMTLVFLAVMMPVVDFLF